MSRLLALHEWLKGIIVKITNNEKNGSVRTISERTVLTRFIGDILSLPHLHLLCNAGAREQ
jgi:hypothetical protein